MKRMMQRLRKINCFCIAAVGIFGVFSIFARPPDPEQALERFVAMFTAQDAAGVVKAIHPDVVSGKEIHTADVESFLKRNRTSLLSLESRRIDEKMKSEDGETERFKATLVFRGPVLAREYPKPSTLSMTLLWVLEDSQWWLERPLSINYTVISDQVSVTPAQQEAAMEFEAALGVLSRIGLKSDADLPVKSRRESGNAAAEYKELEKLYEQERGPDGIDSAARGVDVLVNAAAFRRGGFSEIYHGDFRLDADTRRKPVPWVMFRDYVAAALARGKALEKQSNTKAAERIYRSIVSLGQQFLEEADGFNFVHWGITFQKQGARELARILPSGGSGEKQRVLAFSNLSSRRLDSLQTAFACLDDLTDYRSLQASIIAAERADDTIFKPWGINTLAILAVKGAPANRQAIEAAGGMVIVINATMQKTASMKLDELASKDSAKIKTFIDTQRAWVRDHKVYGEAQDFR